MSQPQRFRVSVLVETSKTYGRGLLAGVSHFVRTHRSWSVLIDERALDEPVPSWLERGMCDGILLRTANRDVLEMIEQLNIPVVYLGEFYDTNFPLVISSDSGIAEVAFQEFWERGFREFGYLGIQGLPWSDRRRDDFQRLIRERNARLSVLEPKSHSGGLPNWPKHRQQMSRWLKELPRPIGILCCYDVAGVRLMDTCQELGISVPEEVAVIAVDDDPCLCDFADPPLSSVSHNLAGIGYQAAQLLNNLMLGESASTEIVEVDPLRLATRQSSDIIAVDDPEIAAALRFIRQHACEGINVNDVLKHIPVTRVTLTRRFLRTIGRTVKEEIIRLQMNRVMQLLTETDFSLETIAPMAGFRHSEYLSTVFKQRTGWTPSAYRQQYANSTD